LIIPIFVRDFFVGAVEGAFEKAGVADEVPVAVLVEFSAGGDEWCGPNRAPLFADRFAVVAEPEGEVDVLDGDEVRVEALDRFEGVARGPEGRK